MTLLRARVWMIAFFVAPVLPVAVAGNDIHPVRCNCGPRAASPAPYAMPMPARLATPFLLPAGPASCAAPLAGAAGMYGGLAAIPQPPADVGPPPGTLGRTYYLPARPVSASKHPRVAMLEVCAPGVEELVLVDTNEFREEDYVDGYRDLQDPNLWRFETDPLIPGLPHIYRLEARCGGVTTDVRYVRLIRGRVLETRF
jgi:hypothetical protein